MASKGRNQHLVAIRDKSGKFPCLLNLPLEENKIAEWEMGNHLPHEHIKYTSTLEQFSLKTTGDCQKDTYTTQFLRNIHRVRWEGREAMMLEGVQKSQEINWAQRSSLRSEPFKPHIGQLSLELNTG